MSRISIDFGKHQGQLLTRVPVDYLLWLARMGRSFMRGRVNWTELAKRELVRRGGAYGSIVPSHHAVDRFSTRFLDKWVDRDKGIASSLALLSDKAWIDGILISTWRGPGERIVKKRHDDITFVFYCNEEGEPLILKTVIQ